MKNWEVGNGTFRMTVSSVIRQVAVQNNSFIITSHTVSVWLTVMLAVFRYIARPIEREGEVLLDSLLKSSSFSLLQKTTKVCDKSRTCGQRKSIP